MRKQTSVTDFNDISSYKFKDWTNVAISNLDRILDSLPEKDSKTRTVLQLRDDFEKHVKEATAHGFTVTRYSQELLQKLYHAYRDVGYTGSIKDMLLSIEKKVDIASLDDVKLGMSVTKAITTQGWNYLASKHKEDKLSHVSLYKLFHPDYSFNSEVVFSLIDINKDTWTNTRYIPRYFNSTQGTLVVSFRYTGEYTELISFHGEDTDSSLFTYLNNNVLELKWHNTTLLELPTLEGMCKVAISLDNTTLKIRDLLGMSIMDATLPHFTSFEITHPNLYEFTYYTDSANAAELSFLVS